MTRDIFKDFTSISLWNMNESDFDLMLNEQNLLSILDLECPKSSEMLDVISNFSKFNKNIRWLLYGNDLNRTLSRLSSHSINIDSMILLVIKNDEKYDIFHIRCPALQRNGLMFVDYVGNFTNYLKYENPFLKVNYQLHGIALRVAICVSFVRFFDYF